MTLCPLTWLRQVVTWLDVKLETAPALVFLSPGSRVPLHFLSSRLDEPGASPSSFRRLRGGSTWEGSGGEGESDQDPRPSRRPPAPCLVLQPSAPNCCHRCGSHQPLQRDRLCRVSLISP